MIRLTLRATLQLRCLRQHRLDRPNTLTDFEDLTEADIVAAVQAKLGAKNVTAMQEQLAARITEQINPTQASGTPSGW